VGQSGVLFISKWTILGMDKEKSEGITDGELFAPCGMFCGFCGSYLAKKHEITRRRGIITYCAGCRPRDKQCAFLTKHCSYLQNKEVYFCSECPDYPCANLEKINAKYKSNFSFEYNFLQTLKILKNKSPSEMIAELKKKHSCDKCGEMLCIHNGLCYNCNKLTLATMKNYRNDK
jgi:hypothetical protein